MVEHICQKCNKTFTHKGAYDRHLSRQKSCAKTQNTTSVTHTTALSIESKIVNDSTKINICIHCDKSFTRNYDLKRHQNMNCKTKKNNEIDILKKKIMELEKKHTNNAITNSNNNTQNTNNGTINNNNITINQYGKEDLSHLTFNDFNGIFNKCNSCVPNLIDLIHFNKDKPENNNIYISNLKGPYAMIYDGHKWNVADKNTTVDDMYDDKCDILVSKYENLKDHLDEKTMNKFTKFLNKYEDEEIKKNITKNIKLMLYNNREIASK